MPKTIIQTISLIVGIELKLQWSVCLLQVAQLLLAKLIGASKAEIIKQGELPNRINP
jgi:hypothetical protein